MSNPYRCPDGVWWLMRSPASDGVLRAVSRLGSARVQWAKPLHVSPAYNTDAAWLLDGKPASIGKIIFLAGNAR